MGPSPGEAGSNLLKSDRPLRYRLLPPGGLDTGLTHTVHTPSSTDLTRRRRDESSNVLRYGREVTARLLHTTIRATACAHHTRHSRPRRPRQDSDETPVSRIQVHPPYHHSVHIAIDPLPYPTPAPAPLTRHSAHGPGAGRGADGGRLAQRCRGTSQSRRAPVYMHGVCSVHGMCMARAKQSSRVSRQHQPYFDSLLTAHS